MKIIDRNFERKRTPDTIGPPPESQDFKDESVDNLEAEVERLREELEIERDARLRLAAEYQNYRRRTEDEKTRAGDNGKRDLLTQLLAIADDLDLALASLNDSAETVTEGVRMIQRRFVDLLEANGVTVIESIGGPFDPERHEAFDVVAAGNGESGFVHKEMRRGYFWNGDYFGRP